MKYNEKMLYKIYEQTFRRFTSNDSSSISYDKAKMLMGAILYTLKVKEYYHFRDALTTETVDFEQEYDTCVHLLEKLFHETKTMYEATQQNFKHYNHLVYEDTILKGMPAFFINYDLEFNPSNTLLTLDYPLLLPLSKHHKGIYAIHQYLTMLSYETQLLNAFNPLAIMATLKYYDPHYNDLIFNITSILLNHNIALALVLSIDTSISDDFIPLKTEHFDKLYTLVSEKSLAGLVVELEKALLRLLKVLHITDEIAINYFKAYTQHLGKEMKTYGSEQLLHTILF